MPKTTSAKRKPASRSAASGADPIPSARSSRTISDAKPARPKRDDPKPKRPARARSHTPRLPPEPPARPLTLEERSARVDARLLRADAAFVKRFRESLDMSWIHFDSAIEGVVYTIQELKAAIDPSASVEVDSSLQPICEEIRRHREALDFVRDFALKSKQPVTVDTIKQIYLILHPEEGDLKTVKYRKDIPQHRLYFHEYAAPDKIALKVRQVVDWIYDPETKKTRNAVRIAARAHYDLLRVFPFATDSGTVARLMMNLLIIRAGVHHAIIHSTERQLYYDALKGASTAMSQIVVESIENNLASIEKLLDNYEQSAAH